MISTNKIVSYLGGGGVNSEINLFAKIQWK